MIGPWRRHASGRHVAVADRLDLLESVPVGKGVEVGEELVEDADDLGRRAPLRPRREADHVGEEDRGRLELISDRLRLRLQLLGDGPRQDVEEQVLGLGLLGPKRVDGVSALLREQRQQGEDDRAADHHVHREHRAREPAWRRRRDAAKHLSSDPRAEEDDDVRGVPLCRCSDVAEHERPKRCEDAPQAHAAGVEEATEGDHRQRRRKQDVQQVDAEQLGKVARRARRRRSLRAGRRSRRAARSRRATRTTDRGRPKATRSAGSARRSGPGAPCWSGCPHRLADRRRSSLAGPARHQRQSWCDAPGSRRRLVAGTLDPCEHRRRRAGRAARADTVTVVPARPVRGAIVNKPNVATVSWATTDRRRHHRWRRDTTPQPSTYQVQHLLATAQAARRPRSIHRR